MKSWETNMQASVRPVFATSEVCFHDECLLGRPTLRPRIGCWTIPARKPSIDQGHISDVSTSPNYLLPSLCGELTIACQISAYIIK